MTVDIAEAIEAACTVGLDTFGKPTGVRLRRPVSPKLLRGQVKEFLRNLPEGMTVQEVLDEL